MSNILALKTVNELKGSYFFIPSYQRGFRWTEIEVLDLLNDINEFYPKPIENDNNDNEETWYCLQPIVVKKRNTNDYEVIDGQQRLTTILLILHYLNQDIVENKRDKLFTVQYETRPETETFLKNIRENTDEHYDNIDFYYIQNAYNTIAHWFEEKGKSTSFENSKFGSKFKLNTKLIWYESFEEDSISIFTRINIGKIPLTNAELIKALFLNTANFTKGAENKLKHKQLEVSTKWDVIEQRLQNDRFWFFLAENPIETNRIELIFNLMNDSEEDRNDTYSTFRYFTKKIKKGSIDSIDENWAEIENYYQRFSEWFEERELYHKIGYLLTVESITIKELYHQSSSIGKTTFNNDLDMLIRGSLKDVDIDEVQYGDKNVVKTLLLYNILTMLKNNKDNSYFPYDIYKKNNWDIEHIASIKDSIPDNKYRKQWLSDTKIFIDDTMKSGQGLKKRIGQCNIDDKDDFEQLFYDITDHFNYSFKNDDIDGISNLALLDSVTNRTYKNAVFPIKRSTIIEKDKQGAFIPICTKNVFLKYFSSYPPKISFWTSDDREKYDVDLHTVLDPFLNKEV